MRPGEDRLDPALLDLRQGRLIDLPRDEYLAVHLRGGRWGIEVSRGADFVCVAQQQQLVLASGGDAVGATIWWVCTRGLFSGFVLGIGNIQSQIRLFNQVESVVAGIKELGGPAGIAS